MPFILGQSLLGYDYLGDEDRSVAIEILAPEIVLGDPSTPGDMEPGSGLSGGEDLEDAYVELEGE